MSTWLRIAGIPATEIGAHTPPKWETLADGGCGAANFAFALTPRSQHQALRAGTLVEILQGPVPVYRGILTDPDRTTWECHATGLAGALRDRVALDGSGNGTRDLLTAISQAIGRGWPGSNPYPVSGTAAGDATGNPVKVADLLDDYAEQTGQRWGVDGFGRLFMRPTPTSPSWLATPDAAAFGTTSEGVVKYLAGRYFDGTVNATASFGSGSPEETVDLTNRGTLTSVAAHAILSGTLSRMSSTVQWTGGVTLHREQLTTFGGSAAGLASVRAGQMMRVHGLSYAIASKAPWLDAVIGKTSYTAGEDVIYLEPVNTAPRNLVDVLAAS